MSSACGTKSTDYRPFLALSLFHKEKYMIAAIQSVLVSMIVVIIQLSPFAIARMLTYKKMSKSIKLQKLISSSRVSV